MSTGTLSIDIGAVVRNWQALDALTQCETGAVVKANGYGLGAPAVARALAKAGARTFFVAIAEEGLAIRKALGEGPQIYVFSGHMEGDTQRIREANLTPMLNSVDQMLRHVEALPGAPFGLQFDTGMNRLGMEPVEWAAVRDIALAQGPSLLVSHLACADEPNHVMNEHQLHMFEEMTEGTNVPRSLAATGGILLGRRYHFDMTRPGIGLYGGMPFAQAESVARLDLPVIQIRELVEGETVGYGNTWVALRPSRIATVSGGYADGVIRAMGPNLRFFAGDTPCPVAGRISMDLIGVDITELDHDPTELGLLAPTQTVDDLAKAAGTIGYEILTSLGARYTRRYSE